LQAKGLQVPFLFLCALPCFVVCLADGGNYGRAGAGWDGLSDKSENLIFIVKYVILYYGSILKQKQKQKQKL
jgi:hypothetical protein